jgi:hypothetical protein
MKMKATAGYSLALSLSSGKEKRKVNGVYKKELERSVFRE